MCQELNLQGQNPFPLPQVKTACSDCFLGAVGSSCLPGHAQHWSEHGEHGDLQIPQRYGPEPQPTGWSWCNYHAHTANPSPLFRLVFMVFPDWGLLGEHRHLCQGSQGAGVCSPSTDVIVDNRGSDRTKLSCMCQLKTGAVTPLLSWFMSCLPVTPSSSPTQLDSPFLASSPSIPLGNGLSFIFPLLCSHLLSMIIWT